MTQPVWIRHADIGESPEHGSLVVYKDSTGVYPAEMERMRLLHESDCTCEDRPEGEDDCQKIEVYRTPIERCALVRPVGERYMTITKGTYQPKTHGATLADVVELFDFETRCGFAATRAEAETTKAQRDAFDPDPTRAIVAVVHDHGRYWRRSTDPGLLVHACMVDRSDLPKPIGAYVEWFADGLGSVASSIGCELDDLIADLCSADLTDRARAYEAIAGYWGWDNFDGYPITISIEDAETRHAKTVL